MKIDIEEEDFLMFSDLTQGETFRDSKGELYMVINPIIAAADTDYIPVAPHNAVGLKSGTTWKFHKETNVTRANVKIVKGD